MTSALRALFSGESLLQRAARNSVITLGGFATGQVIRLASNLILTRLLFPEAFGTMAIVLVFMIGLTMFSDMGIGPAIMQSKRGDDPAFLNTAWTIQIMRGFALWFVATALAWPVATIYGVPELVWYLPVAALGLIVMGFFPTRLETANRHMRAGRLTLIELAHQLVSVTAAIGLALLLQSVWALVLSGLIATIIHLIMLNIFLPGERNRIALERPAVTELVTFGKWIFLSTVCGFVIVQADKVMIGAWLPLDSFGLYNIAYFLASLPYMLGAMVMGRLLIPLYRESPPLASDENRRRLQMMRRVALSGLSILVTILAFGGTLLVDLLYDDRYRDAGAMVVLIAAVQMPSLLVLTSDQAVLAYGASRRF
ncbi:MAG: oligosaccharide flippase family protein, partial [Rubellimicrobium sp.]|nr:oligosaccharide flippase family protein [Rubellimicrobium sp.]